MFSNFRLILAYFVEFVQDCFCVLDSAIVIVLPTKKHAKIYMYYASRKIIQFAQIFLWLYCKVLVRYRLNVSIQKTDSVASSTSRIVISNHVSHHDPFIFIGCLSWKEMCHISPMRPMLAKGYYYSPLLPIAYLIGCYPTKPLFSALKKYAGTSAAIRYGNNGCTLGIYPEGRRVFGEKVTPRYGVIKILENLVEPHVYLCKVIVDPKNHRNYQVIISRQDDVASLPDPQQIMDRIFNLDHTKAL